MPNDPQRRPPARTPIVVKVGGSLLSRVHRIVPVLCASPRPLLLVPGGGIFADAVRQAGVNDDAAHWMAIAAMEQYGWMLASQGVETTDQLALPKPTTVLLPYRVLRVRDPLPHTWQVTSDTIAAWVAHTLGTELLVLKSVDGIRIDGVLVPEITAPLTTDVVDPCFIAYVLKNRVRAMILNGTDTDRLRRYLQGAVVPGTSVSNGPGTTF
ncbi:MAG: uridylate kinase [Methanoregula sp.]|nr:uridylate kinase [Methanoregula sp.]